MKLHPGLLIAGVYSLERPLAVGGMGSVWVAWDPTIEARVAIKFLDAVHADTELGRSRFEREATLLATIHNPHVVATREFRVEAEAPFIVMELLDGEDLGARLRRVQRMSLVEASHLLTQLARGLGAAHEAGIIHRDLKPANVFLAARDGAEIVKLLDFGLAKSRTATEVGESTKTGELLGSPHFMSPEQIRSPTSIDHRSDLWSVAVILFRALTGELPFKGDQVGPVLARILTDPIPAASSVAPDLSPSVDEFFARGLARDPAMRFQSARELSHALATIAHAEPVPYMVMPAPIRLFPAQRGEILPPHASDEDELDAATRVMSGSEAVAWDAGVPVASSEGPPPTQPAAELPPDSELAADPTTELPAEPGSGDLAQAGVYPAVAPADPAKAPVAGPVAAPVRQTGRVPWAAIAFASACFLCAGVFIVVGRAAAEDAARTAAAPRGSAGPALPSAPSPPADPHLASPSASVAPGPAPDGTSTPPPTTATTAPTASVPVVPPPDPPPTSIAPPGALTSRPNRQLPPAPPVATARKKSAWGF